MNYRRIYIRIIRSAQSKNRQKSDLIIYEEHHILPKSLFPLWKYKQSNLVLLTLREHWFIHELATKIWPRKMTYALWRMALSDKYVIKGSRGYERARMAFIENHKGFKHTDESKELMRLAKLGNGSLRGMSWFNNGVINKVSKEHPIGFVVGRIRSEKQIEAVRLARTGIAPKNAGEKRFFNGEIFVYANKCPDGFQPKWMQNHRIKGILELVDQGLTGPEIRKIISDW